ncbi:Lipin/Ned1/Smp2-domain-containing protein [Choanephora cucurbitarum]|nr:Lipin/Ned1/Smp2-domain-containing protein [Choanephora cucurbitarum]
MEYVGRLGSLFTSVQSFYNEINPATLSGAIDIVVVEQEDGDLACSPFHVRFGKLSVLMPQEKKVQIKINGQVVPYVMKVGEAGEAFFVFETEHEVPEEFQTSPIMEATVPEKNDEDPPYLDLGESKDGRKSPQDKLDSFEDEDGLSLPAELQSPKMIIEEQMDKVVTQMDIYHEDKEAKQEPTVEPQNDIYPITDGSIVDRVIPEAITTTTIARERFIVRPAQGDIYSTLMDVTHAVVHTEHQDLAIDTEGHGKGDESIVLDIAGYKTGNDNEEEEEEKAWKRKSEQMRLNKDQEALEEQIAERLWIEKGSELLSSSPPLLSPVKPLQEQSKEKVKEEAKEETEEEAKEEAKEETKQEPQRSLWGWGTRRQATVDSAPTSPRPTAEDNVDLMTGESYRIEMSLCGFSAFGRDEQENAKVFDQHIVTYDNFTHNPNMLNDKRLVFRFKGRYYAAHHTGPLFTSLLLFKKPLEDTTEENRSDSRESYQFGKGWRQWLSRSSVAAPTTTKPESETESKQPQKPQQQEQKPQQQQNKSEEKETTTTFTTTTTTTSVGWSADHVHPEALTDVTDVGPRKVYAKTLRLTSDQLKSLGLKNGANTISFSVSSAYQGTATCAAKIFYWHHDIQIVISDIDGTITKSDTLGHVFTMIGKDWTHMGVAKLYTDIANNGYHFLYLTSRAIGQADYTRDYLKKVVQDNYQLPDGPVIMSPDRLFQSFHREVIMRKPEVFKMACLKDIQRLFGGRDPFYAGFGNRITDARSYRSVNVPTSRIFTIDPYGDLKLELLLGFKSSYIHLTDLVDQIFPPINRVEDEEFNDWNYWKPPKLEIDIPELDIPLEPTSPKPKPIKPDVSALPPSSVVASSSSSTSRSLLRSFTGGGNSGSQTSLSKPRTYSISSNTSHDELSPQSSPRQVAIDNPINDQKPVLSTSPTSTSSIMNKMRSTLSRTFLSSNDPHKSIQKPDQQEEMQKPNQLDKDIQEDVDSLLDNDLDMDDIPFI